MTIESTNERMERLYEMGWRCAGEGVGVHDRYGVCNFTSEEYSALQQVSRENRRFNGIGMPVGV